MISNRAGVLELVGDTPMVSLDRIGPSAGKGRLLAKVEGANPGGSIKDRIALAMILAAEKKGELNQGDTVVEATSGNTGIGLAVVCAARGYRLILAMPEDMSDERMRLFKWFGAEVRLTPAIEGMSGAVWLAGRLEEEGGIWVRQFESPANPEAHYRTTGPEIWRQAGGKVDVLVLGVGTGGTLTGAGRYLKEKNPSLQIVAVEPATSPVLSGGRSGSHRIHGLGAGFLPGILDKGLIDEVVTVDDEEAFDHARLMARKEGLSAGPSSGAAVAAALKAVDRYAGVVVTILPDGMDRYLSMVD